MLFFIFLLRTRTLMAYKTDVVTYIYAKVLEKESIILPTTFNWCEAGER